MIRNILYSLIAFSWCLCTLTGCADDLDFRPTEIAEGETEVKFYLSYKDFAPALESRTAGDAIEKIETLWMVIYKSDGTFESKVDVTSKLGRPSRSPEENETDRVEFTMKMFNGTYHIYAVANKDLTNEVITNESDLQNLSCTWVEWDKDDNSYIKQNAEMFGYFVNGTTGTATSQDFNATEVTIDGAHRELHARLFRLASKVTVAFDGSGLVDGVNIYIKSLRIRNIPKSCKLGVSNKPASTEELLYTAKEEYTGEEIQYAPGETFDENYSALITKQNPFFPRKTATDADSNPTWDEDSNPHSAKSPNSLFFYENNQGTGPNKTARADSDGDGILDEQYLYTNAGFATYIEVEAYYVSDNPKRPGISNITYRFPLGQNVTDDYNAFRNCHYKLTLGFKGYANEPDWRIDYVTVLYVSQPNVVDYRGKYFVPDQVSLNQGNNFSADNYITVTSYQYDSDSWKQKEAVDYDIEYREPGSDEFKEFTTKQKPVWLDNFTTTTVENKTGVNRLKINYNNPYTEVILNKVFKTTANPNSDLSGGDGSTPKNTANCYIVDAPGTYTFPLVYGNAIEKGEPDDSSYKYKGAHGCDCLTTFKNYKNEDINNPYILEDITDINPDVSIVWQDVQNLVSEIKVDQSLYSGKGGITFKVNNPKEGNAVIALKNKNDNKIVWSWHIWITSFDFTREIVLTNYKAESIKDPETGYDTGKYKETDIEQKFKIMPINLGWCSGDDPIRYYDRHECEVRVTQKIGGSNGEQGFSQIVKIVQEPHIALPRGNNPYYQWGRKDPFVAGIGYETSKTCYDGNGTTQPNDLRMIFSETKDPEDESSQKRQLSIKSLGDMIQNPGSWFDCKRKDNNSATIPYVSTDQTYVNLWDNTLTEHNAKHNNNHVTKTIYDPCPTGFHVSPFSTFSGFSDAGMGVNNIDHTWLVILDNMLPDEIYRTGISEFYTDKSKLISIGFPESGYRDWADFGKVYSYVYGFIWTNTCVVYDWGQKHTAYYFNYYRTSGFLVYPSNNFHQTDGMAIRPTITLKAP